MVLLKNRSFFEACLVAANFFIASGTSAPTLVPAPVPTLAPTITPGPSILPTSVPNPMPTPAPTHVPTPYPSPQMCDSQPLICGRPVLESTTGRGDYAGGPASGEVAHNTATVGWLHHRAHPHLHLALCLRQVNFVVETIGSSTLTFTTCRPSTEIQTYLRLWSACPGLDAASNFVAVREKEGRP